MAYRNPKTPTRTPRSRCWQQTLSPAPCVCAVFVFSKTSNPPLFPRTRRITTGEQVDDETGLQFLRVRYYDPQVGRFLALDPASGATSFPLTWNLYVYAYSNPARWIDPLGLWGMSPRTQVGASGGILGGVSVSGGVGPELEFPSWNPLDWKLGVGVGAGGKVSGRAHAELSGKLGVSVYIWDRWAPIPTVSDNQYVKTCAGVSGSGVAGLGGGGSIAACTGKGKTGVQGSVSLRGGVGSGPKGFVGQSVGKSWAWSLRDIGNKIGRRF